MKTLLTLLMLNLVLSAATQAQPISLEMKSNGSYRLIGPNPTLVFQGQISTPGGVEVQRQVGRDQIGEFSETRATVRNSAPRVDYTVRIYPALESVVFSQRAENTRVSALRFPVFHRRPQLNIETLSHEKKEFARTEAGLGGDAPWIFVNAKGPSFILSPADHFMISNCF